MTTEPIDAEAVEVGTEIVPADHPQPTSLFRTDDPIEVVERASRAADALKGVITRQGLTSRISGREHVRVEGWTTLGAMLGVYAVKEWVRPVPWPTDIPQALKAAHDKGLAFGFEASYQAYRSGEVIGGAEASCMRTEGTWSSRDDYALKSMAQTRATSKALRGPLGFIVTLAGFEATPDDEMPPQPAAETGPPFGPTVENATPASNALIELVGDLAPDVWAQVKTELGGYMPDCVARAIVVIAGGSKQ